MLLVHTYINDKDIRYNSTSRTTTTENDHGWRIFVCKILMILIEGF